MHARAVVAIDRFWHELRSFAVDLRDLLDYYPEAAGALDAVIRGIIGKDATEAERRFDAFAKKHSLTPQQHDFLGLLQNHIRLYGSIQAEKLWEAPFTKLHADGVEGVFGEEALLDDLLALVRSFQPEATAGEANT